MGGDEGKGLDRGIDMIPISHYLTYEHNSLAAQKNTMKCRLHIRSERYIALHDAGSLLDLISSSRLLVLSSSISSMCVEMAIEYRNQHHGSQQANRVFKYGTVQTIQMIESESILRPRRKCKTFRSQGLDFVFWRHKYPQRVDSWSINLSSRLSS